MKKNKKCNSLIVAILLMFSIMLAVVSIFIEGFVLNKNTYVNILEKNGIYKKVEETIYNKIDSVLNSKGLNIDIKESIITEDDIKREADKVITGCIQYLKTGENSVSSIDTQVYKQRVSDFLESFIKDSIDLSSKDLSFNQDVNKMNMVSLNQNINYTNMSLIKSNQVVNNDGFVVEPLASREELEAKARAILKEKGLTEAQARQKLAERGISEEQLWKMAKDSGYLDDNTSSNSSNNKSNSNNSKNDVQASNSDKKNNNNSSNTQDKTNNRDSRNEGSQNNNLVTEDPLKSITDKLLNEAGTIIDNEIHKINLNGLMESSKIYKIAKITSVFHKMFWVFIIMPIILMGILIKINWRNFNSSLKWIASSFLITGLIIFAIFFGAYTLRVYENIFINTIYFKDAISSILKYFLIVLSKAGITSVVIGLLLFIPIIKNSLVKK